MILAFVAMLAACSADPADGAGAAAHPRRPGGGGADSAGDTAAAPEVNPSTLKAALGDCSVLPGTSKFAANDGDPPTVPLCAAPGVVWFAADFDVDCDGGTAAACTADPYYQAETSATDSHGRPLDASTLNFAVLPLDSNGFSMSGEDLHLGSVVAVLWKGRLAWAVVGDRGPRGAVGEGSYALAEALGVDPDPVSGGAEGGATWIFFTGAEAVVSPIEDEAAAATLGEAQALALLAGRP
jgi:hypothetical protein